MINKLLAEFLGTMFFLYVILATGDAVAIGLALMAVIFILGKTSGGHFNPAVSVMMAAAGKVSMKDLAPYIVAQVALGLHLTHGVWSLFRTLGVTSAKWNEHSKKIAILIGFVITVGNSAIPLSVLMGIVK